MGKQIPEDSRSTCHTSNTAARRQSRWARGILQLRQGDRRRKPGSLTVNIPKYNINTLLTQCYISTSSTSSQLDVYKYLHILQSLNNYSPCTAWHPYLLHVSFQSTHLIVGFPADQFFHFLVTILFTSSLYTRLNKPSFPLTLSPWDYLRLSFFSVFHPCATYLRRDLCTGSILRRFNWQKMMIADY